MSVQNILVDGVGYFIENAENAGLVAQGVFDDSAVNSGTATTASFSGTAVNSGTITTEAEFAGSASNSGTVAVASFKGSSTNSGEVSTASFSDTASNTGVVFTAAFSGSSVNGGVISGTAVFSDTAANTSGGRIEVAVFTGNAVNTGTVVQAEFRDTASNEGTVSLSAKFADSASNAGTVQGDAIFADTAENLPGAVVVGVAKVAATAVNSGSAGSQEIYVPTEAPTEAPIEAPAAPSLHTANFGNGFADFAWTPNGDGGSGITSYYWELFDNQANVFAYNGNTASLSQSFDLSYGLTTDGRTYTFTVYANNGVGRSSGASATGVAGSVTYTSWTGSYQDCTHTNTHGNLYTDNATLAIGVKVYQLIGSAYVQAMSTWQLVVGDTVYHYSGGEIVSIDSCSGY